MKKVATCPTVVVTPAYYGTATIQSRNPDEFSPQKYYEAPLQYSTNAIPRYGGYIPGKYCETVYNGIPYRMNRKCQKERTLNISTEKLRGTKVATPPKRYRPWERRGYLSPSAGDFKESLIATPRRKEATTMKKSFSTGNIPGYGGHIPGLHAENVYGETWQRGLEGSNIAHEKTYRGDNRYTRDDCFPLRSRKVPRGVWDSSQNKNVRTLLTEKSTVIPRVDRDHYHEVPVFNPSYNDRCRGYSACAYTGKCIDPAGRLAPVTRQEGYQLAAAPVGREQLGYKGFIPGKLAENVIGERERTVHDISRIVRSKTRTLLQT